MNVGSTSVDRAPALQAGLLSCDATYDTVALQVDERQVNMRGSKFKQCSSGSFIPD